MPYSLLANRIPKNKIAMARTSKAEQERVAKGIRAGKVGQGESGRADKPCRHGDARHEGSADGL